MLHANLSTTWLTLGGISLALTLLYWTAWPHTPSGRQPFRRYAMPHHLGNWLGSMSYGCSALFALSDGDYRVQFGLGAAALILALGVDLFAATRLRPAGCE